MEFVNEKDVYLVKDNRGVVSPVRSCLLDYKDFEEAMDFNRIIYNEVGNQEIYALENSIERNLKGEGFGLGIRLGTTLIAMCIFSWVIEDMVKVLEGTYMEGRDMNAFSMRDIVIVHPDYRGNGLHRRLISEAESLIPPGKNNVISTVAPVNWPSLRNVLASGYYVVACKELYGGHSRFITWQDVENPVEVTRPMPFQVSIDNVRGHQMALDVGGVGYSLKGSSDSPFLRYGKVKRKSSITSILFGDQGSQAG